MPMKVTLELSPDEEARLREAISRKDSEKARRVLAGALASAIEEMIHASTVEGQEDDDWEKLADQLADEFADFVSPDAPALPPSAISREGIYKDHL